MSKGLADHRIVSQMAWQSRLHSLTGEGLNKLGDKLARERLREPCIARPLALVASEGARADRRTAGAAAAAHTHTYTRNAW